MRNGSWRNVIKVMADTNYLLDLMDPTRNGAEGAVGVFDALNADMIEVSAFAGSLNDVYFITRNQCTDDGRRAWLTLFLDKFNIFPVDSLLCRAALASDEPDFEDAMIRVCAEWWEADYILSRDRKAFGNSHVPRVESPELLRILRG